MDSNGKAVTVRDTAPAPVGFTREQVDLIKRTIAADATDDELQLFVNQAQRMGLDPFAKQIYYVKRQGKGTIQVGIDGYRLVADRTGKYAGNDDPEFVYDATDPNHPKLARVTVWKLVGGQRCPFTATARWSEYVPDGGQGFMWKRMPHVMLGKVAEALALRKAFPAELSGTYVDAEMDQAEVTPAHPPQRPTPAPPPPRSWHNEPAVTVEARVVETPAEQPAEGFVPAAPLCTQPQVRAIYAMGKRMGKFEETIDQEIAARFGKDTLHISKAEASTLIQEMQAALDGDRR